MTGSVRRQLIAYFVIFALALGGLFAVVTLLVFHRVEDLMMERRLEQLLGEQPGPGEQPSEVNPRASSFVGPPAAAPPPFPERLEGLGPGLHEWEDDGQETHALLVVDPETAVPTVAIGSFPESAFSETLLETALLIGITVTSLLAMLLASYLAVRIVSPIERLTERLTTGSFDGAVPEDLAADSRDDEIGTLARALQHASRELTASAERERRFLREASHELRTPITVIQGVLDLLRESAAAEDTLTQQRLDRLDRGLRRMNTSVLSLLTMARAEHRLTANDAAPFRQQLEDLVEEARSLANSDVAVTSTLAAEPSSDLAASMLIVALSNLARNAAQHTESGTVHVAVDADRARVSDTGPGLPPRLLEQLRSTGPQPDAGIGLATVQKICQRFGWCFEVECPSEGGTIATIKSTATHLFQVESP